MKTEELMTRESLEIRDGEHTEDSVCRVHGHLILGRVANEALRIRKGDITRGGPVTLVVGNDLDAIMLPHSDTTICSAEVDADGRTLPLAGHGEIGKKGARGAASRASCKAARAMRGRGGEGRRERE